MSGYKTMRVPEDAWEDAKDALKDDETWGEYLRRCAENPPETVEVVDIETVEDVDDAGRRMLETIEERTGRIEQTLDNLGGQY